MNILTLSMVVAVGGLLSPGRQVPSEAVLGGEAPRTGILVMAHGGTPEWNASVDQAVAPLRAETPVAVAYGMADPMTMQAALDSLAAAGVERVAVVRMFMSGESFRHQSEYLLGLRADPPENPMLMHGSMPGPGHEAGHSATHTPEHGSGVGAGGLHPLRHDMQILMSENGLMESWVSAAIMKERAAELSVAAGAESVLLVAHGMGDEGANERVLAEMSRAVEEIHGLGFRDVRAFTLREDWDEARAVAETEIRETVAAWGSRGDRVLALPFRLSGFGPYAEVLGDFDYQAGEGLLPHPLITDWIRETAGQLLNQPATAG